MFAFKQEMLTEIFSVFIWSQVKQTADKQLCWKIMTTISLYKILFITVSSNELDLDHIKENKSSVISGL